MSESSERVGVRTEFLKPHTEVTETQSFFRAQRRAGARREDTEQSRGDGEVENVGIVGGVGIVGEGRSAHRVFKASHRGHGDTEFF